MFFRILVYLLVLLITYTISIGGLTCLVVKIDIPNELSILIIPLFISGLIALYTDDYLFKQPRDCLNCF